MAFPVAKAIDALFQAEEEPRRLVLHAGLHRICREHVQALYNLIRKPQWRRQMERTRARLLRADKDSAAWRTVITAKLGTRPVDSDRLLVDSAGTLQALDHVHAFRRGQLRPGPVRLPAFFGAEARTLFLPPAAAPIADWVPSELRLDRDRGDLENEPKTLLDLSWHLVEIDRSRVRAQFTPLSKLGGEARSVLESRLDQERDLRFALAAPFMAIECSVIGDSGRCGKRGTPYRFRGIPDGDPRDAAREELQALLASCAEQEVDVLCLPELTVDALLLGVLADSLKLHNPRDHPALVMAGSGHVRDGTCWRNRCTVLDGQGNVLFEQDKTTAYRVTPAEAGKMEHGLLDQLGIDQRGGYEDIDVGEVLRVVDTPIGRLSTPICLDYCGDQVRELLVDCGVNLLLVPAMTPRMRRFRARARELGTRARAASFVINSAWLLKQLGYDEKRRSKRLLHVYLPALNCSWDRTLEPTDETETLHLFTIRVQLESQLR